MLAYFFMTLLLITAPAYAATELERVILQELNVARTQPEAYIRYLEHYRTLFKGKTYIQPGTNFYIRTEEGTPAIDEAITFLRRRSPLRPLRWADGLARSGAELVRAQSQSKETGHGSGRLAMAQRIQRHGRWTIAIGEAITYGPYVPDRGRDVIAQLIVDDGVPGRGHRTTLFDKDYRLAGVSCGFHPTFETVCVIDFAGGEEGK
ncbi:MAG: CAP domain-containing protein [Desulfuromonadales bacterium]|nr:CAP domain-containing protein [Desulfuromonadales bacterium]